MTNETPDPWEPIGGLLACSLRESLGNSLGSLWDSLEAVVGELLYGSLQTFAAGGKNRDRR